MTSVSPNGSNGNDEDSNGKEQVPDGPDLNNEARGDEVEVEEKEGLGLMHLNKEAIFKLPPVIQQPCMKLEGVVFPAVTKMQKAAASVEAPRPLG